MGEIPSQCRPSDIDCYGEQECVTLSLGYQGVGSNKKKWTSFNVIKY